MALFNIFGRRNQQAPKQEAQATIDTQMFDCIADAVCLDVGRDIGNLCIAICANMVGATLAKCEVKTYASGAEQKAEEYWLWNVEPNRYQNSTDFWKTVVNRLFAKNECLIIDGLSRKELIVADSFCVESDSSGHSWYTGIVANNVTIQRLEEKDVLHIRLHTTPINGMLRRLQSVFDDMQKAAVKKYIYANGNRLKVKVGAMAQAGTTDANGNTVSFERQFADYIKTQIMPFLASPDGILPQFDGYEYTPIDGGYSGDSSGGIIATIDEMFNITARAYLIPAVMINGKVEAVSDAERRFFSNVIDPLANQIEEEINRKRYGYKKWKSGDHCYVDTSNLAHFDIFASAEKIEKLVGSGVFSINDVRTAAGQSPLAEPWADEHFLTLNFALLQNAIQPSGGGE